VENSEGILPEDKIGRKRGNSLVKKMGSKLKNALENIE